MQNNILLELADIQLYNRVRNISTDRLKNAFFANLVTTLFFIRMGDLRTLNLLQKNRTKKHNKLEKHMLDVYYWAYFIFNASKDRTFEKYTSILLTQSITKDIATVNKETVESVFKMLFLPDDQINWKRIVSFIVILANHLNVNSSYLDQILPKLITWKTESDVAKINVGNKCFLYLTQADDNQSWLIQRLKTFINKYILNIAHKKLYAIERISEDDVGSVTDTSVGNIANTDNTFKKKVNIINGKVIKRRKKKFKLNIFKRPDMI